MWWLWMVSLASEPMGHGLPEPVSASAYEWSPLQQYLIKRASGLKPQAMILPKTDDPSLTLAGDKLSISGALRGHAKVIVQLQCNAENAQETFLWEQQVILDEQVTLLVSTPSNVVEKTQNCDFAWSQVKVMDEQGQQLERPFLLMPSDDGFRGAVEWEQQIVAIQPLTKKFKSFAYLSEAREAFLHQQAQ